MPRSDDDSKRTPTERELYPKGRVTRRQAIQRVVAGGTIVAGTLALPKKWTRPVIDIVVSPAEGQGFSCPGSLITILTFCPMTSPCIDTVCIIED